MESIKGDADGQRRKDQPCSHIGMTRRSEMGRIKKQEFVFEKGEQGKVGGDVACIPFLSC